VNTLRVACVGAGWIAGRHLAVLSALPEVRLTAVADTVPERAEGTAAGLDARAYHDGLALLAEEELDAVWLCVPPYAHGPLELAALERNLPFFVEKPLAADLPTAERIAAEVERRGLLTAVGYHWRHVPVVERAVAALAEASVRLVMGHWLAETPPWPWWSVRERSGGQVIEQATHVLDLARLLAGEVVDIDAAEAAPSSDGGVPPAAAATLRFASGAVGTVAATSILGWRHRVGLHVAADGCMVEFSERTLDEHEVRIVTADGEDVVPSRVDPIAHEDREFVAALRGELARVRVPYAEALRSHALACAVDRAARAAAGSRSGAVDA